NRGACAQSGAPPGRRHIRKHGAAIARRLKRNRIMQQKIEVGVLGATGMVGQHFVKFLRNHPWFELTWVGASDRSAGKLYKEATSWRLEGDLPRKIAELPVQTCEPNRTAPKLVFSATDASVATEIERSFAQA